MRETWYVLEDGDVVDPNDVAPNEAGRLVHVSGRMVAMRGSVPSSCGVDDADAERSKMIKSGQKTVNEARAERDFDPVEPTKDMQAERPKRAYKRRDVTAG